MFFRRKGGLIKKPVQDMIILQPSKSGECVPTVNGITAEMLRKEQRKTQYEIFIAENHLPRVHECMRSKVSDDVRRLKKHLKEIERRLAIIEEYEQAIPIGEEEQ